MFNKIYKSITKGVDLVRNHSQLSYTLFVGFVIIAAFSGVMYQFLTLAQDAQDRLTNVRIGSIQDAVAPFMSELIKDRASLNSHVREIAASNETIKEFVVTTFTLGGAGTIASLSHTEDSNYEVYSSAVLDGLRADDQIFLLARSNPSQSYTTELSIEGERYFRTLRAYTDGNGSVVGMIASLQSLSEADQRVNDRIRNSVLVFLMVVISIMFLFFRLTKIIDYATLYRKLQEIDKLKDDFIAMASHELRTPLTVIRGYIDLLDTSHLSDDEKEFVRKIDVSARQLSQLVAEMLDVSRIEQGRMKFDFQTLNVKKIVSETVDILRPLATEKGLDISFTGIDAHIHADEMRFRQVMINMIGNAIKYTPKGRVDVTTKELNANIEIRISDTGVGMTAEELQGLFTKFYRVHNKETSEIRGTGLGLWLSQQIIEKMYGTVSVESIKGVGTHFVTSLPIVHT